MRPSLLLLLAILALAVPARGDTKPGVIGTPDDSVVLVSKDVGTERWAITFSLRDATITGNVFRTDGGEPSFVYCTASSIDGSLQDLAHATFHYECLGNDACHTPGACPPWNFIANVTLPGAFFLPSAELPVATATPQPTATPVGGGECSKGADCLPRGVFWSCLCPGARFNPDCEPTDGGSGIILQAGQCVNGFCLPQDDCVDFTCSEICNAHHCGEGSCT